MPVKRRRVTHDGGAPAKRPAVADGPIRPSPAEHSGVAVYGQGKGVPAVAAVAAEELPQDAEPPQSAPAAPAPEAAERPLPATPKTPARGRKTPGGRKGKAASADAAYIAALQGELEEVTKNFEESQRCLEVVKTQHFQPLVQTHNALVLKYNAALAKVKALEEAHALVGDPAAHLAKGKALEEAHAKLQKQYTEALGRQLELQLKAEALEERHGELAEAHARDREAREQLQRVCDEGAGAREKLQRVCDEGAGAREKLQRMYDEVAAERDALQKAHAALEERCRALEARCDERRRDERDGGRPDGGRSGRAQLTLSRRDYAKGARLRLEAAEKSHFLIDRGTRKYLWAYPGDVLVPIPRVPPQNGFTKVAVGNDHGRLKGWLRTSALVPAPEQDLAAQLLPPTPLAAPAPAPQPAGAAEPNVGEELRLHS